MNTFPLERTILSRIFAHMEPLLLTRLKPIIQANAQIHANQGLSKFGVYYMGKLYTTNNPKGVNRVGSLSIPPLNESLHEDMANYCKYLQYLQNQYKYVQQAVHLVLKPCKDWQDVGDALPDFIWQSIEKTGHLLPAGFVRTRPPAFTLEGNTRHLKSWNKALSIIEESLAMRLLI